MMALSTSFIVLVAALLISTPSYCCAENVYCVTHTATSCSSCPHNSIKCSTLSEYAQEAKLYFTTNTTMVFLPGDHALDTNITVANVARLAMRGESSSGKIATVVCSASVGFKFKGTVCLKIYSLAFKSCSRKYAAPPAILPNYAMLLQTSQYAELVNCSFHDNIGTALVVNNTNITLAGNSEFTHNHCETNFCTGGGIVALSSNLTFTGNTTFLKNIVHTFRGISVGGAIYASPNTVVTFNGFSNFISNSADYGGAIYTDASAVLFNGISNFITNSAEIAGGAIYAIQNTVLSFNGIHNFINHSADNSGGAIFASQNTALTFSGISNFTNNSAEYGGAIYTSENTVLSFNGTNNFISNSANYGGTFCTENPSGSALEVVLCFNGTNNFISNSAYHSGGAIYALKNTVLSFHGIHNFINHSAGHSGGVIYASQNTALNFSGISNFTNNSADYGGAICTIGNTALSFNGMNNFISNSANYGGTFYTENPNGSALEVVLCFNGTNNFISNSANYGGTFCTDNPSGSALEVVLCFNGTNNFISNSAYHSGGAIYALKNTVLSFHGIHNFINHSAGHSGGVIYASQNTALNFSGISNFTNNSADYGGAICTIGNTALSFNGMNNFISNSANYGGTFYTENPNGSALEVVLCFNGTNNFISNSANYGGTFCTDNPSGSALEVVLCFNGTNNFISNSAYHSGGAIYTLKNTALSFNGIHNFINHSAEHSGGAIYASQNTALNFSGINNFTNNSADYGGAICTIGNTALSFNGTNNFISNSAYFGGAIYTLQNSSLSFSGTSNFISNSAEALGGAICMYTLSNIVLRFSKFINNSAHSGGAIYARDNGAVTLNGIIYFTNNRGRKEATYSLYDTCGGGVYMGIKSTFSILPNNTVYWENNHATLGGAIYVQDASPVSYCNPLMPKEKCFFQLPGQNLNNGADVQLIFKNNSADAAGSVLFGGAIDNCELTDLDSYSSGEVFDMIVNIGNNDYNTTSIISSKPIGICPCENNLPDCMHFIEREVYPGETFQVSVIALGQRNGTVPSTVSTIYLGTGDLSVSQYHQVNINCTKLSYTVRSLSQRVGIELHAESSPCSNYELLPILTVNLYQTCPPGFNISESKKSCVCVPRLARYTHQCNITNNLGQITREAGQHFWAGYENQSHELILHPHCPFDYCVNDTVVFPLNNSDIQCAHNRSGLLCGRCREGYSQVLGSTHCRKCTYSHLVLLIPFAVMGVTLVFFLLVCKLTVATGMLSGLVFYANIVGPNRTIFLPVESTNVFSVFIAWLNLDFGIETCFFDGLDVYSKTWLQFVFPVYIWVLVGLMIAVSHFSHRFANLLGNNPVSVLATLILLSYTKILHTLITVLYVTYLEYPTHNRMVWLYDANIDYLNGKHIPLFIVAMLVFFFLFLPYTLLLLCSQWLQAISHLRLFSWINSARLKPFMDSYHAPYKPKHRYWPGLLLVLRFVLLLVFAFQFNPQQDRVSINLLAILVGTGILVVWAWVCYGVYRNWCLDALEGSFALNLIFLVGATYYVKLTGGNQLAIGCTSVSIAFATFIGIIVLHLANVTGITRYVKRKCAAVVIRNGDQAAAEMEPQDNDSLPDRLINPGEYEPPFHIPQRHATVEPIVGDELVGEAQRRLIPVYTYGSIN